MVISYALIELLLLFWTVPTTVSSSIASVTGLAVKFPFLKKCRPFYYLAMEFQSLIYFTDVRCLLWFIIHSTSLSTLGEDLICCIFPMHNFIIPMQNYLYALSFGVNTKERVWFHSRSIACSSYQFVFVATSYCKY